MAMMFERPSSKQAIKPPAGTRNDHKIWRNDMLFCSDLPTKPDPEMGIILVSGASGYIGGRLVPELLARGYRVRALVRGDSPVYRELWPEADIVVADVLDTESVQKALKGVHSAFYLIHSLLLGKKKFESVDIQAAINFRKAAETNNVRRIIYLGGLGDVSTRLSPHLRSRMEIAEELKKGSVPVTVLRAAIIIGSGSSSYEIIKNLVKNVPVFFSPRWARTKCQPISIRDVIKYLVGVLELSSTRGKSYDIGGEEILTYEKMLRSFAKIWKKKRVFIPLPVSSFKLYSYIISLFTPVPHKITMCLMVGCRNEVVCHNDEINKLLPFQRLTFREAVIRAMTREEQDQIHTRWSDAYPPAHELAIKLKELDDSPMFTTSYSLFTKKDESSLFKNICEIGGKKGWFNTSLLWRLRGILDRMMMGVGTARGRRSSQSLRINDVIDFWRVEDLKKNKMLLLRAEMKLPGKAWLKFVINRKGNRNQLLVKAFFYTQSFFGKLYWIMLLPFHYFIFYDIIHQIEKRS